jgi:hypothetical protein
MSCAQSRSRRATRWSSWATRAATCAAAVRAVRRRSAVQQRAPHWRATCDPTWPVPARAYSHLGPFPLRALVVRPGLCGPVPSAPRPRAGGRREAVRLRMPCRYVIHSGVMSFIGRSGEEVHPADAWAKPRAAAHAHACGCAPSVRAPVQWHGRWYDAAFGC